ncbi:MAG: hypothetical protein GON13_02410 [Nanoarchaeota archaeon]|nr:hypothetical protein [Nanoarchaeota archaeon]
MHYSKKKMKFLRIPLKAIEKIGKTINQTITITLLIIVYFTSINLTSITGKTFRKKFLSQTKKGWTELRLKQEKKERYYQQF